MTDGSLSIDYRVPSHCPKEGYALDTPSPWLSAHSSEGGNNQDNALGKHGDLPSCFPISKNTVRKPNFTGQGCSSFPINHPGLAGTYQALEVLLASVAYHLSLEP